jgi:hypothetical protein
VDLVWEKKATKGFDANQKKQKSSNPNPRSTEREKGGRGYGSYLDFYLALPSPSARRMDAERPRHPTRCEATPSRDLTQPKPNPLFLNVIIRK